MEPLLTLYLPSCTNLHKRSGNVMTYEQVSVGTYYISGKNSGFFNNGQTELILIIPDIILWYV